MVLMDVGHALTDQKSSDAKAPKAGFLKDFRCFHAPDRSAALDDRQKWRTLWRCKSHVNLARLVSVNFDVCNARQTCISMTPLPTPATQRQFNHCLAPGPGLY